MDKRFYLLLQFNKSFGIAIFYANIEHSLVKMLLDNHLDGFMLLPKLMARNLQRIENIRQGAFQSYITFSMSKFKSITKISTNSNLKCRQQNPKK